MLQGLVPGPKLFILCIKHICKVSSLLNCVLFADGKLQTSVWCNVLVFWMQFYFNGHFKDHSTRNFIKFNSFLQCTVQYPPEQSAVLLSNTGDRSTKTWLLLNSLYCTGLLWQCYKELKHKTDFYLPHKAASGTGSAWERHGYNLYNTNFTVFLLSKWQTRTVQGF